LDLPPQGVELKSLYLRLVEFFDDLFHENELTRADSPLNTAMSFIKNLLTTLSLSVPNLLNLVGQSLSIAVLNEHILLISDLSTDLVRI
jgi:hypothetical protein